MPLIDRRSLLRTSVAAGACAPLLGVPLGSARADDKTYVMKLGTATINLASTTKGCSASDVWQVSLAAGGDGTGIQMARTNQEIASGSAIKQ